MTKNFYQQASFIKSVAKLSQLPSDSGIEVAFVGRSNAGKSSAINRITTQKQLAKTSKTPGRTQLINLFGLDSERRLIDLPGYGYAKVGREIKAQWQNLLSDYLQSRQCLRGLILLMDIRHPWQETDCQIIDWLLESQLACHILLTKADKLKPGARQQQFRAIAKELPDDPDFSCQLFSATKGIGVDEARQLLNRWFNYPIQENAPC